MKTIRFFLAATLGVLVGLLLWTRPGYGWVWRSQVTTGNLDASQPASVRDSQGRIHLVWLQKLDAESKEDAFYTTGDGVTWAAPHNLSNSTERTLAVKLAVNDQEQVAVLWVDVLSLFGLVDLGSQMHAAVWEKGTWSEPQALSSPLRTPAVGPPALAVRGSAIHAVWAADTNFDSYGDAIYHAIWDGTSWSTPAALPLNTGTLDAASLAFDGDGRMHLAWDGNTTGNPADLNAYQIYYAHENEGGWTTPVDLSQTDTYSFLPALALDGDDHPHVLWMEEDTGLGQGNHIFDRILYQRWDGSTWLPTPRKISYQSGALFPQAASDATGAVHFLWNNNISDNNQTIAFRLYYARWDGARLSPAVRILATASPDSGQSAGDFVRGAAPLDPARLALVWSGGDAQGIGQIFYGEQPAGQISQAEVGTSQAMADSPDMAGAGADDLHAVWSQGTGPGDILYSHWGGVRWSNPYSISLPGFSSLWPAIALGPDAAPHVVWYGHDDQSSDRVYYTRLTSTGWFTPTLLSHEFNAAAGPDLAVDTNGDVHAVWEMTSDADRPGFAIYYRRTEDGGQRWLPWERLSPPGHNANRTQIALDPDGRPHVVWYDVGEEEIYYTQRLQEGWSPPENISQSPATAAGATIASQGPSVAVDAQGRVYAAWMDSVSQQYLDSIVLAVRDGGQWQRRFLMSRPDVTRDMDLGAGVNVQVAVGEQGAVHVLWHDVGDQSTRHIYESNNLAGTEWSLPTRISLNAGDAIRPAAFVDAAGALHFMWSEFMQTRQIFYQRQDRFDWLKVVDEEDRPQPGALIYADGKPLGRTDARGILLPAALQPGAELTALAQVYEYAGVRGSHASPDAPSRDWTYRIHLTNWRYGADGQRMGDIFSSDQGETRLTVRADSPLALFNLVVSLEWEAEPTYTEVFSRALALASDYLFDASNGQMAIGHAAIYAGGEKWQDADIQVLAYNHNRPNADINGLRDPLAPPIRVGRSWSGLVGGAEEEGAWDRTDGYRTLIHEFGHYALGLWDSYFRIDRDDEGNQTGLTPAHCTGPEIQTNELDPVNATLMDYQYNATEFAMRNSPAWNEEACTQTEQFARHGESDWETIRRFFADAQSPSRWRWQTPAETGVLAGPGSPPLAGLPTVVITPPAAPGVVTPLVVEGPGDAIRQAFVVTYGQGERGGVTIDQGQTDSQGRINLLGVRDGDMARALSWDAVYSGEAVLTAGVTNTLVLTRTFGPRERKANAPRRLRLLPDGDGASVEVHLFGLGPGASLDAHLGRLGRIDAAQQVMGYSETRAAYRAVLVSASAAEEGLDGLAQVWVEGADVEGQSVYVPARAVIYALKPGVDRYLASPDGRLRLTLPPDAAPDVGRTVYLLVDEQNTFGLVEERSFLSPVYEVRLSGALPGFTAPVTLAIHEEALTAQGGVPPALAHFDEAAGTWRLRPTTWDGKNQIASAPIQAPGYYALLSGAAAAERVYLPSVWGR